MADSADLARLSWMVRVTETCWEALHLPSMVEERQPNASSDTVTRH